jgi:DHA1 family tetracycline resistance protein-like MFS transporter
VVVHRRPDRVPLPPGFGAIWSTVALDLVGFGIILPVLPLYARRFHASPAVIGVLVASFSVAQLVLAPVWGRVSDRIGRKPVLIVSLVGTAAGSLLTGLAGGMGLLFLGRIIDGASGASVSVAQASVADIAVPSERARLFGLLGAAFGLGFVVGPALGGLLALVSARLPFLVAAGLAATNAVVAMRRLPETHRPASGGGPSLAASPSGPKARVRSLPGVPGLLAVAFLSLVSFSAFEATFALFGSRRLGLTESSTYGVFVVIGVLIAFDQVVIVRPCVARFGERGALRAGLALNGLGLVLLAGVHSLATLVPSLVLLTIGQGLITPTLSSAVAGQAPARDRGRVLGVQQSVGGAARVVGPALGGLAFGHLGVWVPYVGGAGVLALALAVLVAAPRPATDVLTA